MVSQLELQGRWNEVKGRLQERWGELTEDDLRNLEGNADQLVGAIQRKTGESRQQIEDYLEEIIAQGGSALEGVSESARQYGQQAAERFNETYDYVAEGIRSGYGEARDVVRRNPAESVAVAFGAGLIAGVIVGLVLRSR